MAVSIPQGYKQTGLGLIPEDWEVVRLGQLLQLQRGFDLPSRERNEGSVPIISSSGVCDTHNQHKAKAPGVVTGRYGTIGNVYYVEKDFWPLNTTLYVSKFFDNDPLFVSYLLKTIDFESHSGKSGVPGVNRNDLHELLVCQPTKTEQTAIANALSDADVWIQSLTHLIAKKRQIKQGATQRLLSAHENGVLKDGWVVKALGDVADILTGFPFPSSGYATQGIRLVRGSNIKRGETDWSEHICQYWPKVTMDIKKFELEAGDIVVAMDGSLVGRSFAQVKNDDLPSLLLQRVARIRPKSDKYDVNYIKEWVCSEIFTDHCDALKTVTAIPHISPADIDSFKLGFPAALEEQTRIASILSGMDTEITQLEIKLSKAKTLKQGMMQNLLTGKIRLVEPQEVNCADA